jgi:hypothetical protein
MESRFERPSSPENTADSWPRVAAKLLSLVERNDLHGAAAVLVTYQQALFTHATDIEVSEKLKAGIIKNGTRLAK